MDEQSQSLEEQLAAHARSATHARARALAAGAPAPTAEELAALADGRLEDPVRREALARQLMTGEHWRQALDQLVVDTEPRAGGSASPARTPALWRPWWALVAAAAALLLWIDNSGEGLPPGALAGVRLTDAAGLELRGGPKAAEGRVLVRVGAAGVVSLVHEASDGRLSLRSADADGAWVSVAAGDELLLPLHRSVELVVGERWVVVLAAEPLDVEAALAFARRALAGEQPTGPALEVITVDG